MRFATDSLVTFICTRTIFDKTGVVRRTNKVRLARALGVRGTGIGTRTFCIYTGIVLTNGMTGYTAARGRITGTGACTGENNAGCILTFGMFVTVHFGGTRTGTGP